MAISNRHTRAVLRRGRLGWAGWDGGAGVERSATGLYHPAVHVVEMARGSGPWVVKTGLTYLEPEPATGRHTAVSSGWRPLPESPQLSMPNSATGVGLFQTGIATVVLFQSV